jgi:colanic acid biosynthesis glycosyl transferase WcaI
LADQILTLYQQPELVERLGKQGRQYAIERYSFEQALNQYEALFAQVTDCTAPVPPTYTLSTEKPGGDF